MVVGGRPRRRRRPRLVLLAIIGSVLAVAVNSVVSRGTDGTERRLAEVAYLDDLRPSIENSIDQGRTLTSLYENVAGTNRAGMSRQLERAQRESADVLRRVRSITPPMGLRDAHALLVASLVLRADAVDKFSQGVDLALEGESVTEAAGLLSNVGEQLTTADRNYELFVEALPEDRRSAISLPNTNWVTDSRLWSGQAMRAFVTTLRSIVSSSSVHDIAVIFVKPSPDIVRTDPADEDLAILPIERDLSVDVVIANVGNEPEKKVEVVATVRAADGTTDSRRDSIDLAEGARRAITFRNIRVIPEGESVLEVVVGPARGEAATDDNTYRRRFVMR